jgi:guanylate kinase
MVAATAAGRNTIIKELIKTGNYHYLVSDTTRPPRVRDGVEVEHDGVEYFFRPENDVLDDLKQGKFVGPALIHQQQVSGIGIREIQKAHETGRVAITDIEPQGCEDIAAVKPDVVMIFVLAPSFEEWLHRINNRSALPAEEIKNRLEAAVIEIDGALKDERFIFVVNDVLAEAVHTVDEISREGKHHRDVELRARLLAAQLRDQAAAYVARYPNW